MRIKKDEKYIFTSATALTEKEFKKVMKDYEKALEDIKKDKSPKNIQIIKQIQKQLKNCFLPEKWPRNIIKFSSTKDKKIWAWQDSLVFEFQTISWWIYKEWKTANKENLEYMIKKYRILKKYLWKLIPDSYFIIWQAYEKFTKRWFKNWAYIANKLITIQRKIKGKDLTKFKKQEKLDKIFLQKLEKAHRKYILLKIFIEELSSKLQVNDKLDIRLDLWPLSKKDRWDFSNPEFIFKNLISPNIMYDGENIYFIDFWFGTWNQDKEKIHKELIKEETYKRWEEILKNFEIN